MQFTSLDHFRNAGSAVLTKGPCLMVLAEDSAEIESTLDYHLDRGAAALILVTVPGVQAPSPLDARVHTLTLTDRPDDLAATCVNAMIAAAPEGTWLGYVYNAEYLFYPFSENRTIGEMLVFVTEERRDAVLSFVVDLYPEQLSDAPNGVSREHAMLDAAGYYALARDGDMGPKERQLDFFGGLRWRYEEHVPYAKRRIDRVSLFRAKPGLSLTPDHRMSDEEMNTYACPWHHSLTASVASFRAAKALATNPGSRAVIDNFTWFNSRPFDWSSTQLMDLGLMEPGQWF